MTALVERSESTEVVRRGAPRTWGWFSWLLRVADLAIFLSVHLSLLKLRTGEWTVTRDELIILSALAALVSGSIWLFDGWRLDPRDSAWRLPLRFAAGLLLTAVLVGLGVYLVGPEVLGREYGIAGRLALGGTLLSSLVLGVALRWWLIRRTKRLISSARWLLLSEADDTLVSRLVDDIAHEPSMGSVDVYRVGSDADQPQIDERWTGVVLHGKLPHNILMLVMQARLRGIPVLDLPDFYERYWHRVPVVALDHHWFAVSDGFNLLHSHGYVHLKRIGDVVLAFTLLLLAAPIMLIAAIAVRFDSPGPVLYRQQRTGLGGRIFTIAKFRSMRTDAEAGGARWASTDDPRVTRVGKFLRRSRIDELPQLWNVLVGDMSMIGPRPERPEFNEQLEQAIPWYDLRHLVKPGLSGWAQVNYPYGASVEDALRKLEFDLYYIKNQSLLLDAVIVLRTIRVVMHGFGSR